MSDMSYEEAVRRWAGAHLGLLPDQWQSIDSVDFTFIPGGPCVHDTCDFSSEIVVSVSRGLSDRELRFPPDHFGVILQQIYAVAVPTAPSPLPE